MRDPSMRPSPFQAYVRIMIGCDKFCTYCIVPSVRGPEQSRPPEHIAAEVRQLAAEGCKEITLLGQTVNSYKYDHGDGRRERLSDLLARIHDTPGIERIKFITNFPARHERRPARRRARAAEGLPVSARAGPVGLQRACCKRMKRLYTVEYLPRHAGPLPREGAGRGDQQRFHRRLLRRDGGVVPAHLRPGARGRLQEQLHLQVQPAARHQGRTSCSPTTCPKRSRSGATTICWRSRTRSAWPIIARRIGQTVEVLVEGPSKNGAEARNRPVVPCS